MMYNNALMTITDVSTPDPYVTYALGKYFFTFTAGDRVEIWSSPDLLSFGSNCNKHIIWRPPPNTHYSGGIWAPELHDISGRWYVYVAAEDPQHGNKSHRMYVLGGPPSSQDPCSNTNWDFLGPIRGLPESQWAIDGTLCPLNNRLYFVYSGWPSHNPGLSDKVQELYIVEMQDALTAVTQAARICEPSQSWERSDQSCINEGPQFLAAPDGSWVGIVYSCAGSWTADYKMNTLQYLGGDPLSPNSWRKGTRPLLQRNGGQGPFGPGHGSFLNYGGETVAVFHATDHDNQGWDGRKARVQRVLWTNEGPSMGGKVGSSVAVVDAFWSGQTEQEFGRADHTGRKRETMRRVKGILTRLLN